MKFLTRTTFLLIASSSAFAQLDSFTLHSKYGVPLDRVAEAGQALREAAAYLAGDVCARFESAAQLSDGDREMVIQMARQSLAAFQPAAAGKT